MIGIIGAMGIEVEQIKASLKDKETSKISGIEFNTGKLSGKDVVVAACGIGKVAAAVCVQTMILKFEPELIINTGVGGTLTDRLSVGDVAIADYTVQHDMDTSPLGDPLGLISGINIVKMPCSGRAIKLFSESFSKVDSLKSIVGTIASGDQFVNSRERKEFIVDNFDAVACDMECAALGQVCYINNVDFGAVRAISDSADGESHVDYTKFLETAAHNAAEVVKFFIEAV